VSPKRRHKEFALAGLFAVVIVLVGGVAIVLHIADSDPVHGDPASVPSTVAFAPAERYSGAVDQARRLARALLVKEDVPAVSVAAAVDGEIVWAEAFGVADVERRTPVTPRTRFRTGSVSKTLTAAAVALLYERGRIDLDAPIQTYVSAYPRKQWTITPRQLLGDVAGVDGAPRGHCTNLDQALQAYAGEPIGFEPGTEYRFSTYGWILLSAAVEGAANEPFATFMSRELFEPLGMDRTVLEGEDEDADIVSLFPGIRSDIGLEDAPLADYACFFGAGRFLSTPSDLVRLGSMMVPLTTSAKATAVKKPDTTTRGLLKPETITLFQTPLRLKSGASTGFALGWKVDSVPLAGAQIRMIRHRGNFRGGASSLSVFPDRGLVVAVTASAWNMVNVDAYALQVAEMFVEASGIRSVR
jgi:CubicO group peptidase (beta-lactamase class C family)